MGELIHSVCGDNNPVPFHLWSKETTRTDEKRSQSILLGGCSSFEVGIVKTYVKKVTTR